MSSSGRTVVITGGSRGIGLQCAMKLAALGDRILILSRDPDRGPSAARTVSGHASGPPSEWVPLDLADMGSINEAVKEIRDRCVKLDVLINNAAIMQPSTRNATHGLDIHVRTNYLGHFALTMGLLDLIHGSKGSRIVNVTSIRHRTGSLVVRDGNIVGLRGGYSDSKLAIALFTQELQRRFSSLDGNTMAITCHPGIAYTDMLMGGWNRKPMPIPIVARWAIPLVAQTAEKGARSLVYSATCPELIGGEFVGPGGFLELRGKPSIQRGSPASYDPALSRSLWDASLQILDMNDPLALHG